MLENMDARDEREPRNDREAASERPIVDRPITDREVPLDAHARADARATIHQWLDGEVSEAEARRADAAQVEFWNQVGVQADQRRRMTTPAHVSAAIMSALPEKAVRTATAADVNTADDSRLSLTPLTAAAAAAGFTALGVLIGRVIGR